MGTNKILITGGAGFIGSEFVRLAAKRGDKLFVVDKLTYAADLRRLEEVKGKYAFFKADICDRAKMGSIFTRVKPDFVVHFAAETHVDRSIQDPSGFLKANLIGTQVLMDASRKSGVKKFVHISTDEVYGDIKSGKFREDSPFRPNSPYAASKAAADLLVNSYIRTYGFPAVVVRPSNNYGPWQYPEKLIPVAVYKAINSQKIPVYAKGLNRREWLFVSDCAQAIYLVMVKGRPGDIYNAGSGHEEANIKVVKRILSVLKRSGGLIEFVKDRPGHDFRYRLDSSRIARLGWSPKKPFGAGLAETVAWYCENYGWTASKAAGLRGYWKKVYKANR